MIDIALIRADDRIRQTGEAQVRALMDSIADVGLMNPVTVFARPIIRNGQTVPGFGLVAGAHRLEACKRLGLAQIEARVVDLDEQTRIIAECDENLCGTRLSPAEVATFTARRKAAYEVLHPETAHGKASKNKEANFASFDRDQAERTGAAARTVRLNAERGEKIVPEALAAVTGTRLNTGVFLDRLKALPSDQQLATVNRELAADQRRVIAPPARDDADVHERQLAALMAAWNRAAASVRQDFLDRIGATA